MGVSFAFIANRGDALGHQQSYRVGELAALGGVPRGQDATNGRLGIAAKGLEAVRNPSINQPGTVFLLDHTTEVELKDPACFFSYNTVMFEGTGYMCVTHCNGNKYTGVSIAATALNLNKLSQKSVPLNINRPTNNAQRTFTPSQLSGSGDYYNNNADDNYNNMGDNPADNYNNVGKEDNYNNFGDPADNYNNVASPATVQKNKGILRKTGSVLSGIKKKVRFG